MRLEHFSQSCSDGLMVLTDSGLLGFWLRFRSVTGFFKPAPSQNPRHKPKILAAHRYIFSVNALRGGNTEELLGVGDGQIHKGDIGGTGGIGENRIPAYRGIKIGGGLENVSMTRLSGSQNT